VKLDLKVGIFISDNTDLWLTTNVTQTVAYLNPQYSSDGKVSLIF
jgi:hypothetical protein